MHGPTSVGWSPTRARTTGEETAGNIFFRLLAVLRGETGSNNNLHTNSVTSTAAGASSHNSYPIAQILTVNQPRGIFSGGGVASHVGVWRRVAPTKCVRLITPTHTRERRACFPCSVCYPGIRSGVLRDSGSKPMVMGADAYPDSW